MNSSYGSDGMNTEKYHKVKLMNKKQTERAIRSNAFMDEQKISDDSYLVKLNPENCSCKTPLQVAFFVLDNAKYWYLNFIYNFMYKCLDINRIHFIEGDTDSAYWAVSGNPNEDFTQQFNAVINDRDFYNDNAKYYFPSIRGDVYDERKILGLATKRQGISMTALAPKNYIIETSYCANAKIKLKGVNQKTNKITKAQIIDCINEGKILEMRQHEIRLEESLNELVIYRKEWNYRNSYKSYRTFRLELLPLFIWINCQGLFIQLIIYF
ncbi:MAG: hypothetical protein EZS28_025497 [Streblomastix strix]|uniref:DNA-directed DNA polymerase n=1 Tax=Streblomastix strix TaxID=222440 RepID=A0A5J4V8Y9_9EUKA|nr:MAG: hypothetical protein EZS28_025497 [Streblomastix strix]